MDYTYYMQMAYEQALMAYNIDETPIGCVIVYEGEIIGTGYNRRNIGKNPLYHAEIIAINQASGRMGDWRLEGGVLFVTVEPCPMCAGAIVQSRITRVVYGAKNRKAGCAGSVLNILNEQGFNHQVDVVEGIMEKECSELMSSFFKKLRNA